MKPIPRYNFPVNIAHYIWDVDDEKQRFLYDGIYDIILNFCVEVMFVPEIGKSIAQSISNISSGDSAHDETDARLLIVSQSAYSVTPNERLAGQEEVLPPLCFDQGQEELFSSSQLNSLKRTVFYVSSHEFEVFHQEIALLNQEVGRTSNSKNISELKGFEFAEFILNRVVTSKYFNKFELAILGR